MFFAKEKSKVTMPRGAHDADAEITHIASTGSISGVNAFWREGDNFYGYGDHAILKMNAVSGEVTTFAGQYRNRWLFTDGVGTDAEFANLQAMWGDGSRLYVMLGMLRAFVVSTPATAEVTTLTGGAVGTPQEGPASTARLGAESGIWGVGDYLYVTDAALWLVYKIDIRTGEVSTFAGGPLKASGWGPGEGPGYVDGPGPAARFRLPQGIWSDGTLLYVTDTDKIRTISVAIAEVRTLTTIPGSFLSRIWGDSENVYVTGYGGTWRVSRSTGAFEPSSTEATVREADSFCNRTQARLSATEELSSCRAMVRFHASSPVPCRLR